MVEIYKESILKSDCILYNDVLNIIWDYFDGICLSEMDVLKYKLKSSWNIETRNKFNEWLDKAKYIDFKAIRIDVIAIGKQGLLYRGFFKYNGMNQQQFESFVLIIKSIKYKNRDNDFKQKQVLR